MELSSPVTAALPHRILTCFPILPGFCPGHYLASCWFRLNGTAIKELGREIRLWGDDVKRFGAGKDFAQRRNGCNVMRGRVLGGMNKIYGIGGEGGR